jgi:hypothetical protein
LSQSFHELIRGASHLRLEEGQPKLKGVFVVFEETVDGFDKVGVDNVFHVN